MNSDPSQNEHLNGIIDLEYEINQLLNIQPAAEEHKEAEE
jgi:hypothetical protein